MLKKLFFLTFILSAGLQASPKLLLSKAIEASFLLASKNSEFEPLESLIGFSSVYNDETQIEVSIHQILQENLISDHRFTCVHTGSENDEGMSCSPHEPIKERSYIGTFKGTNRGAFTPEEFIDSLQESLDIFSSKISPLENLQAVKAWRSFDLFKKEKIIRVRLDWKDDSNEVFSNFFRCHIHVGGERDGKLDCHRDRKGDKLEP